VDPLLDVAEIEDVALRYLDRDRADTAERVAVVIGTGMVGQGLVAGLMKRGWRCRWVYFRNAPAVRAEDKLRIEVVQLEALAQVLPHADVVISAVDVQAPVVTCAAHRSLLKAQGVTLIDLGMPRNIDRGFDACEGQFRVADLDVLKPWARADAGVHEQIVAICERVMDEHRESYERIRRSIQGELSQPAS